MPTRLAITGAAGRLGRELLKLDWGDAQVVRWTRADADLSKWEPTRALFERDLPSVVLHAAASTDLVRNESDKQHAWENIALPAIHVARGCSSIGARMVQVSTDYVFDGEEPTHPIPTWMRPDPINYHGLAKLAAESAARAVPDHLVVRCTMKERGVWKHPQAPNDMWISHSYVDEVAAYLRRVALTDKQGIAHFGARQVNVFEQARSERPDVKAVTRADLKLVRMPRDLRLEVDE